jgi:hypothetical protein
MENIRSEALEACRCGLLELDAIRKEGYRG